ncbi:hypothetical protein MRX96_014809 [Rhipicephalus microplus]
MKGRWTTSVDAATTLSIGSRCKYSVPFGCYAQIFLTTSLDCRSAGMASLRPRLRYNNDYYAMETGDARRHRMFLYDNDRRGSKKLCNIKSQNLQLRFGVAVYDLEYEDYGDACADLNAFGAFSRVKMVRKIVDYYGSLPSDASDCEKAVPCVA